MIHKPTDEEVEAAQKVLDRHMIIKSPEVVRAALIAAHEARAKSHGDVHPLGTSGHPVVIKRRALFEKLFPEDDGA